MTNFASTIDPSLLNQGGPSRSGVMGWLREQISYFRSMRELNSLDWRTLEDIGIAPDQFSMLARRHARGLPPIERSTVG